MAPRGTSNEGEIQHVRLKTATPWAATGLITRGKPRKMRTTKLLKYSLLIAAAICLFSFAVSADTLELKNGDVLHGQYSGGSETTIRFVINGETRIFRLDEVTVLHLGADDQNQQSPVPPPVAPPPMQPDSVPPIANPPASNQPPVQSGDAQSLPPASPPYATAPTQSPAPNMPPPMQPQSGERVTVPIDSPITIRMVDSIDSRYDQPGKRFHATLDQDLLVNGILVAPKGTDAYGRLIYASQAGHIQGRAELRLELTTLMINGQARAIATGEYHLAGKSRGKQSGERIGGAAIGGAIIGGIIGGGQGAAAGAALGAGAGTAVQLSTEGDHVKIPSETQLEFKLSAPFTLVL